MKVFNIVFVVLFILFAALQYNDPDPYIWVPLYLYGAFLCFMAFKNKFNIKLYWIGLAVYVLYAIFLFFDKTGVLNWVGEHNAENIAQSMEPTKPWIEETREFFGLMILVGVLLTNMIWKYRRKRITGQP
jgi:hypothetical protein